MNASDAMYLGVAVAGFVLTRRISSYYILNISDPGIDLTGVIGTSNLVTDGSLAGYHLYYMPRYLVGGDEAWERTPAEWKEHFLDQIRRIFPDLEDESIVSLHVSSARNVQPLLDRGYRGRMVPLAAEPPGVWLVNSSQCFQGPVNLELIVGHAVRSAREIASVS